MQEQDGMIILETGANKGNNMLLPQNELILSKENKMEDTENPQYQHCGGGTAMLIHKRFNFLSA